VQAVYGRLQPFLGWCCLFGLMGGGAWFLHDYTVTLWIDGPWTMGLAGAGLVLLGAVGLRAVQIVYAQRGAAAGPRAPVGCRF
jgi:hypothetical protein